MLIFMFFSYAFFSYCNHDSMISEKIGLISSIRSVQCNRNRNRAGAMVSISISPDRLHMLLRTSRYEKNCHYFIHKKKTRTLTCWNMRISPNFIRQQILSRMEKYFGTVSWMWCDNCTGSGFRSPLPGNFSDEIDSIHTIIGFKHDGTMHEKPIDVSGIRSLLFQHT